MHRFEENMNMQSRHNSDTQSSAYEDEDKECRICRSTDEGRPLFKPCKCSGSIGLTHQECLIQWLDVKAGDGRCDLCKVKFKFAPKYAEGAPENLRLLDVVLGLAQRAAKKWIPFALRIFFAVGSWLCLLPLLTAYLYQGWMHRPSSISSRFKWNLLLVDTISGAVIAGTIIVSFLSLMSFADFLRLQWRNNGQENGENIDDQNAHGENEELQIDPKYIVHHNVPPRRRLDHKTMSRNAVGMTDEGELLYSERAESPLDEKIFSINDESRATANSQNLVPNDEFMEQSFTRGARFEAGHPDFTASTLKRQRQREMIQKQIFDAIDREENLLSAQEKVLSERTRTSSHGLIPAVDAPHTKDHADSFYVDNFDEGLFADENETVQRML